MSVIPDTPRRRATAASFGKVPPSTAGIDPDGLGFGEIFDRGVAVFASEAGISGASPWESHVGRAEGVDPDRAGIQLPGYTPKDLGVIKTVKEFF